MALDHGFRRGDGEEIRAGMKLETDVMESSRFLRACRREPVDATPVWFMRQAGRYMAEYRAIRAHHSLLEICRTPKLAAEVTLQPVERLGVDAAILFADILLPLEALGAGLSFAEGEGPVLARPVRTREGIDALRRADARTDLGHVGESVAMAVRALAGRVPLIGFAGGLFTVASYLVEGGSTRTFLEVKRFLYRDEEAWHRLLDLLGELTADYLAMQIDAGASAIQLFDSWVGMLGPAEYRRYVLPHTKKLLARVKRPGVPIIHFGTQTSGILAELREAGGDVIGLDWRIGLADGWRRIGADRAVQGNLDPLALFAPRPVLEDAALAILEEAAGRPGHVFNLGHGILPDTPVAAVADLVGFVHEESARIVARASTKC